MPMLMMWTTLARRQLGQIDVLMQQSGLMKLRSRFYWRFFCAYRNECE
jgi:hypothetical protein